jgi:hypothetical protein
VRSFSGTQWLPDGFSFRKKRTWFSRHPVGIEPSDLWQTAKGGLCSRRARSEQLEEFMFSRIRCFLQI